MDHKGRRGADGEQGAIRGRSAVWVGDHHTVGTVAIDQLHIGQRQAGAGGVIDIHPVLLPLIRNGRVPCGVDIKGHIRSHRGVYIRRMRHNYRGRTNCKRGAGTGDTGVGVGYHHMISGVMIGKLHTGNRVT